MPRSDRRPRTTPPQWRRPRAEAGEVGRVGSILGGYVCLGTLVALIGLTVVGFDQTWFPGSSLIELLAEWIKDAIRRAT